jgi:hypothetical protein
MSSQLVNRRKAANTIRAASVNRVSHGRTVSRTVCVVASTGVPAQIKNVKTTVKALLMFAPVFLGSVPLSLR